MKDSPVIVALDFDHQDKALALVDRLDPALCKLKVGKELFTRSGPELVSKLIDKDFKVFLDLKFHDIPNTTAKAVAAAADLGVWMVNVHASGGQKMMETAASQLQEMNSSTLLIAVTVLTSMGDSDLHSLGVSGSTDDQVQRLAKLTKDSGLDGVVCSAREAGTVRDLCGVDFLRVTPGIRPLSSDNNDQVRVMTPSKAIDGGSTHLVIGRPVTAATNPHQALLDILEEIRNH